MLERFKRSDDRPVIALGALGIVLIALTQVTPSLARFMVAGGCLSFCAMMTLVTIGIAARGRVQLGHWNAGWRFYREHEPVRFALALTGHGAIVVILLMMALMALMGEPFPR